MEEEKEIKRNSGEEPVALKKKKNIIPFIVGAVVLLAAAVAVALFVYGNTPAQRLKKQLSLAERYMGELDYQQAVAAYKAALEINPEDVSAREGLYQAYLAWGGSLTGDEAIRIYEEAIAADPSRPDAYHALLGIYAERGDSDAMISLYKKAEGSLSAEALAAFREQLFAAFRRLIDERLAAGDIEGAMKILEAAEKIDSSMAAELRRRVTDALLLAGTEDYCYRALALDPSLEEAYLKLIDICLAREDYKAVQKLIRDGESATGSEKITEQRKEIPYVLANDIQVEENGVWQVSYDDYTLCFISLEGYLCEHDGISVEKGESVLKFDSITEEKGEDGMKVITIHVLTSANPYFRSYDNEMFHFNYLLKGVGLFDYYSGKYYNSRPTSGNDNYSVHTELRWKDRSYDVYKDTSVVWDQYWDDDIIYSDWGWEGAYHMTYDQTCVITVPEDYDGLMLTFRKTAGDCSVENDYYTEAAYQERKAKNEKYLSEEHYLLDPDQDGEIVNPEEYYFIRLTDELIAQFNEGH